MVGAPPILVYFSGDWDAHWGYGILTHGQMGNPGPSVEVRTVEFFALLAFALHSARGPAGDSGCIKAISDVLGPF